MGVISGLQYRMGRTLRSARQSMIRSSFTQPTLGAFESRIVESLRTAGAAVSSIDELTKAGFDGAGKIMEYGARLFEGVDFGSNPEVPAGYTGVDDTEAKGYVYHVPMQRIMEVPEAILWGLNERIMDIAEAYMGMPVSYRGFAGRKDIANGVLGGSRMWHLDGEDSRILKVIVYLNDVDEVEDGPFEFVPRPLLPPETPLPIFNGSRVRDEDINARVPEDKHVFCTGKAGTVLFADPCTIWHRGAVGRRRDRKTLFFAYNTRHPLNPGPCTSMFDPVKFQSQVNLSPRQRAALITGPL